VPGCPIRRSGDLILVCSSPRLIAAYHVLHRLLEPRHPPCALIRFKTIQIFTCLTTCLSLKKDPTKSYSVLQFFPNMSKNFVRYQTPSFPRFADDMDSNHSPRRPVAPEASCKELFGRLTALVENVGVEPTTPCLQSRCSSQLS
jgi:hypothetical protein